MAPGGTVPAMRSAKTANSRLSVPAARVEAGSTTAPPTACANITQRTTVRIFTCQLLVCCVFLVAPTCAQHALEGTPKTAAEERDAVGALRAGLDSLLSDTAFTRTIAAVEVSECGTGRVFYQRQSRLLLRPASLTKLFTIATAVSVLPPDSKFNTGVYVRHGDALRRTVWIRGGGDPLFGGEDIEKIADVLRGSGIHRIDTLAFDATLFRPGPFGLGWTWDDQFDGSFAYLTPFCYERNRVRFTVVGSTQQAIPPLVTWSPSSPLFRVISTVSYGDTTDLAASREEGTNNVSLAGTVLPGDSDNISMSIWDPEIVIGRRFSDALLSRGMADSTLVFISLRLPGDSVLLDRRSHMLTDVLPLVGKNSDNTCAEMVLRRIASAERDTGITADDGLAQVRRIAVQLGVPDAECRLCDGSGLSQYNLLSPAAIGALLRGMAVSPQYARFRRTLSVSGTDGTLARRLTDTQTRGGFIGKTGTMGGITNLAGYAEGPDGRPLAVVIMMQNFTGSSRPLRDMQDRIVRRVLAFAAARGLTRVR
jgi:serine-type D-Ala-D-Ala carboxypeptidase/endopeptidase (penicillin-binding protein 4)